MSDPNSAWHTPAIYYGVNHFIPDFLYSQNREYREALAEILWAWENGMTIVAHAPWEERREPEEPGCFRALELAVERAVPLHPVRQPRVVRVWHENLAGGKQGTRERLRPELRLVPPLEEPGHNVTEERRPTSHSFAPKLKGEKFKGWGTHEVHD